MARHFREWKTAARQEISDRFFSGTSSRLMPSLSRILISLTVATGSLTTLSCMVATPQWRIERNTSLYHSLPDKHREMASRGTITKGMSQPAVYLALGTPSRKIRGFRNNASFERWDYTRLQPHFHHSFHTYHGYGSGRHGSRYHGFGFSPSIGYLPSRSASVTFQNGLVESWEFLDPRNSSHLHHH